MVEKAIVIRAQDEVATFEELEKRVKQLGEFYKSLMQKGTDYGVIPGTPKPTLLKPGAELLRLWAGLAPRFEVDNAGTDLIAGVFCYDVKCTLHNRDGDFVGEGVGNCNSLESRYRYRWIGEGEERHRIETENPQDQANTILKMAKKRAFVDAILTVTGASRIFTQDIEDTTDEGHKEATPHQYWCSPHQTLWFKRGKMRNYAHPIKDANGKATGEWCNMPEEATDEAQEGLQGEEQEAPAEAAPRKPVGKPATKVQLVASVKRGIEQVLDIDEQDSFLDKYPGVKKVEDMNVDQLRAAMNDLTQIKALQEREKLPY